RVFNEYVFQMPRIFPATGEPNIVILVTATGAKEFSSTISAVTPDLNSMEAGAQCFPLYLYDEAPKAAKDDLFTESAEVGLRRRDAITDAGLAHFKSIYSGEVIGE